MAGRQRRITREHNDRAWLAWHVAALTRAKKLPDLVKLQINQRHRRPRQSWQEQFAIMGRWIESGKRH
jgi:hypothetical protein